MQVNDWIKALKKGNIEADLIILNRDGHGLNCADIAAFCKSKVKVLTKDDKWPENFSYALRWGCTANMPFKAAQKLLNEAKNIHRTFNKGGFRREMNELGIAPRTFNTPQEWLDAGQPEVIIRPKHHIRGQDFHRVKAIPDVIKAIEACGDDFYMSEVINVKKEFRVFFFAGRVLWVCFNQREQNKYTNVLWSNWNMDVVKAAREAIALSDLDFGAVDVMWDGEKAYVSEVNTSPEVLGEYQQSRVALAIDYLVEKGAERLPITGDTWKHYLHPAMSDKAVLEA